LAKAAGGWFVDWGMNAKEQSVENHVKGRVIPTLALIIEPPGIERIERAMFDLSVGNCYTSGRCRNHEIILAIARLVGRFFYHLAVR
jgi:hypothetical protein